MTYQEASKLLKDQGQEQVLRFWDKLGKSERVALLAQVASIDFAELSRCRALLVAKPKVSGKKAKEPVPPKVNEMAGVEREKMAKVGEAELRAGRVGVLLVAGGQGSRLGFDGPKGAYSIGPISGNSLFYFHSRKILALNRKYSTRVPFYIMTSVGNYDATVAHFKTNNYFGLDKKDVIFFRQGMWPGMDDSGKIVLDAPGRIFMSPDGHGGMISALKANGCFDDMRKRGIETLFYFQVDNPLVEVADPAFIGLHVKSHSEYSLKLCAKRNPGEGLGMVVKRGNAFDMIEYTEMPKELCERRTKDGDLYFKYGSPAIHVFSRAFLEKQGAMPIHLAHKKIPVVGNDGKVVKPSEPNGWKFEKFIFDCLPKARKVTCMAFDRRDEFSPVKNAEGKDSPATCQADLQAKWRRILAPAGVKIAADIPVEIDPVCDFSDAGDGRKVGLCFAAN